MQSLLEKQLVLSHHNVTRIAAILLPVAAACSQRTTGRVIQAGRPVLVPAKSAAVVLPTAERYLGVKYKWGGTSPTTGFDCSGYVQYVFAKHGVKLPRTSRAQASAGDRVGLDFKSLRTGDLIMFASNGKPISHVALYAGNRRIIHSSKSGSGVRYDDLMTNRGAWYRENAVVARRVGTEAQGRGIVRDLVAELRASGVRVDFPLDIGDFAPKP
ncbi:MAG: C40 family peptidase [Gemmatimonadaceae bacterium]